MFTQAALNEELVKIDKRILKFNRQITAIDISLFNLVILRSNAFEEHPVKFGIGEMWQDVSFMERNFLYHMDNYVEKLRKLINYLSHYPFEADTDVSVAIPKEISGPVSFELNGILYSFAKMIEEPVVTEICKHLRGGLKNRFPLAEIKRENVDGLFWRINILRNRMVHPDKPKFDNQNGVAKRYLSFSSEIFPCVIRNNKIELRCRQFDLEDNERVKEAIKKELVDKDIRGVGVYDILFPHNAPKGSGKKSPEALLANLNYFDCFANFFKLQDALFSYIEQVNTLVLSELLKNDVQALERRIGNLSEETFIVKDVFSIEMP